MCIYIYVFQTIKKQGDQDFEEIKEGYTEGFEWRK